MKFVFQMTEAEKAKLKARQDRMLREAVSCLPAEGRALLVLQAAGQGSGQVGGEHKGVGIASLSISRSLQRGLST